LKAEKRFFGAPPILGACLWLVTLVEVDALGTWPPGWTGVA
jgi:hypothetical protein